MATIEALGIDRADIERLASHAIALHWQEVYARLAAENVSLRECLAEHGIDPPGASDEHGTGHALKLFRLYLRIAEEEWAHTERMKELFAEVREARGFLT